MMNPMQMIQMIKGGGNPQQMIQQMMGNSDVSNNPMAMNAMKMLQNGDNSGLQKMAENMCKERGITVDTIRKQLGI